MYIRKAPKPQSGRRRVLQSLVAVLMLAGAATVATGETVTSATAATANLGTPNPGAQPPLQPAAGEYFAVPAYVVLDTRSGIGESQAEQLASESTLAVDVTGADGVPSDATSVVVILNALNATTNGGYITAYDPDNGDPNVPSIGVQSGVNTSQTEAVPVSNSGTIALANHTSASLDVAVSVVGYFTGDADSQAGDTYQEAEWTKIVDTTSGLGAPDAQIAADSSLTFQVSGEGSIASGADTAVIQLSALNATHSGYMSAYAAGATDPNQAVVRYAAGLTYTNMVYVPLSSSGQVTVTNHGGGPVDLVVVTRAYFMPPATSPVGSEYVPTGPDIVLGSSSGGVTLAADASVTFQVAGAAGLPAAGVTEVAEDVVVTDAQAKGYLDAYRADGTDTHTPSMYFAATTGQTYVSFQDSLLSRVSPTGQETISNDSSGSFKVQVSVLGMYYVPQAPPSPTYLGTVGTDTTTPVLSGIVQDSTGDAPIGEIFLFDASGNPIGGSPTATGQVESGERVSWPVTAGTLTDGDTYQWYMEACDQGVCSPPTATQSFTVNTGAAPAPPTATATATISGSSVTAEDAISDSGACSGADCPLTTGSTINVGSDGTNNWASALTFDVSSIPAGSDIVSATLQLTESGCLTGTTCSSSPVDVYQPSADVASQATGPELASVAMPNPLTATAPSTQGSWDVTGFVQSWVSGDGNDGLILQAAAAGDDGISYYSPTADVSSASLPALVVSYIPPAVPGAPTGLTVTPGDGGVLVNWGDPADWNYIDGTDNSSMTFTVTAQTGSTVAATTSTANNVVALTGLTDGTSYTISVTAVNPIGDSTPVTSSSVIPVAVTGSSTFAQATSQYVGAVDELNSGQAANADAALSEDSQAAVDSAYLSDQDLSNIATVQALADNDQQDTSDSTTLSDSLTIATSSDTYTEFTVADETFTTVDTSSGTAVDVPGSAENELLLTYSTASGSPVLTGEIDADAAFDPSQIVDQPTAFSDVLDGPAMSSENASAPTSVETNADGVLETGTDSALSSAPCHNDSSGGQSNGFDCANISNEMSWAKSHAYPGTNKDHNGFADDCTDFASRVWHFGGGVPEDVAPVPAAQKSNNNYWYQYRTILGNTWTSYSWATAQDFGNFLDGQGSYFLPYASEAQQGDMIFANWRGKTNHKGWGGVSHTGVITSVTKENIYITQHSNNRYNEPLYGSEGSSSWFGKDPNLVMWIAIPARKA
jgi:Putative amidase domain